MNSAKNLPFFKEKDSIEVILKTIIKVLSSYSYLYQAAYMESVLKALLENEKSEFEALAKKVDIWGGSGAVWEVYIQDREKEKEFQTAMIKFIELLNKNGIRNYGMSSIRALFVKEVKRN